MKPFDLIAGDGPIILAQPHDGNFVPNEILEKLNATGQALADTDWHITKLYEGLCGNATIIKANFHRYVIDANRGPADISLYPGQNSTSLCPITDFDGFPIYKSGMEPTEYEISNRRRIWHDPYHHALQNEIERVKSHHGIAIVYDCHSIRSHIPYLFSGTLPDLNIGTNEGRTCSPVLQFLVHKFAAASSYSTVLNGRFRGGWTTRHYGQPQNGVHVIQMEIAQRAYLEDEHAPWNYSTKKSALLRPLLKQILGALADHALTMMKEVK